MSTSALPPSLESLGRRPFSFYPAVVGIEHNEWIFDHATWSEVLVINSKTNQEVWVPRRFLGEVSKVDEPVMIVGLRRELEFKAGSLWPFERRVIEIPKALNTPTHTAPPQPELTVGERMGIRLKDGAESKVGKLILAALLVGMLLTFAVISFFKGRSDPTNVEFVGVVQQQLGLSGSDDYHAVVRKLGQPKADRWRPGQGEMQYRALQYPERGLTIILMGTEQDKARYIGALDENWKPVDAVPMPGGRNTRSMLARLSRF